MLHPEARALLDLMIERQVPAMHTLAPVAARAQYLDRRQYTQPEPPAIGTVDDLRIEGPAGPLSLRMYQPPETGGRARPALVYYHGGGWVIGDLDTHDVLCRELCAKSGCVVFAVDYRLAPEHPFPAATDDCLAATSWIFAHAADYRIDASRIALGGDSAGGNLAAVTCLQLRDRGAPRPAFQLLIYPATDARRETASYHANGEGYLLTQATMAYYDGHYLRGLPDRGDWRASPLRAPDLAGLPPALVLTAGFDPLRDEGLAYADRLSQAGVPCTYVCFERQIHGFITMGRVLSEARAAVALAAVTLKAALA